MSLNELISLPRGGYLVQTSAGHIQFGSPPETIKDTMKMASGVPQLFVLPMKFFNWIKGISVAEVEFPIYYNFFLKKRKTYIVCSEEQYHRFKKVLREAVFGPQYVDIRVDLSEYCTACEVVDLNREIAYFRGTLKLSDMVGFILFKDNQVKLKNVTITIDENDNFQVIDGEMEPVEVPGKIEYNPTYDIGERLKEPFRPPLFGVTCLGPSHGFDPDENTSGFILWVNRHGIMVDPPVNSTEWLVDSNVNPKLIDSIILTHCHADHDAGTFQKILEENIITVYTTETIMNSFLRKYSALTNTSPDYLKKLFNFRAIKIDEPEYIHSACFDFFYSLHSIPTIGFKMNFQGKSFVYSSDHNNDPAIHKKLYEESYISEERYKELCSFPWDSDFIYHESGIPPLHTPIAWLDSLPEEIKRKTTIYHIAKSFFPESSTLAMAKFGMEHTFYCDVAEPKFEKAYQALRILSYLDFFGELPIHKAYEFISIIDEELYDSDEVIIRKGTPGDKFYIIYSGNVGVITGENLETRKIYGPCDYFGEAALVTGEYRAADVIAETNVTLFTISKDKFLNFIRGTEFERTLKRLATTRDSETWNLLSTSSFFQILTSTQKTMLESMLRPIELNDEGIIIAEGQQIDNVYIIRCGEVQVTKSGEEIATLGRGDFIGAMVKVHRSEPADFTFTNREPVSLYAIDRDDILQFLDKNPGLIMKLVYDFLQVD